MWTDHDLKMCTCVHCSIFQMLKQSASVYSIFKLLTLKHMIVSYHQLITKTKFLHLSSVPQHSPLFSARTAGSTSNCVTLSGTGLTLESLLYRSIEKHMGPGHTSMSRNLSHEHLQQTPVTVSHSFLHLPETCYWTHLGSSLTTTHLKQMLCPAFT